MATLANVKTHNQRESDWLAPDDLGVYNPEFLLTTDHIRRCAPMWHINK